MVKSELLEVALEAAQKAEKVIMKHFSGDIEIELKDDQSPLSIADTEAERIIVETIRERFPEHGFLGEEFGEAGKGSEYLWIIDPIDGTNNFVRGMPLFATQIALMKGGELVLGVSNAPALKELMYAERGQGAYLNGEKVEVSKVGSLSEVCMTFGGVKYFDRAGKLESLVSLIKNVRMARGIGDCWSYHLLAQGKMDVMIEADTKIWDIAALKIIVEEAGGVVTDINGKKINRDSTSIIAANPSLHGSVLKYFS
jgi:histidinol-phosphatase